MTVFFFAFFAPPLCVFARNAVTRIPRFFFPPFQRLPQLAPTPTPPDPVTLFLEEPLAWHREFGFVRPNLKFSWPPRNKSTPTAATPNAPPAPKPPPAYWKLSRLTRIEAHVYQDKSTGSPLVTDLCGPFSARDDEPDPQPNQPKLTPDQLLARAFMRDNSAYNTFAHLSYYEMRLERSFYRAHRELQRLRAHRSLQ
jgi:hypothetical protein